MERHIVLEGRVSSGSENVAFIQRGLAEIGVEIFALQRPVVCKRVFSAGANGPTRLGFGCALVQSCERCTTTRGSDVAVDVALYMSVGQTASAIDHEAFGRHETNTGTN